MAKIENKTKENPKLATPKNKDARIVVKVTDRFGKEYIQTINP